MFEIFNESNKEIKEIDKLQEYMKFVVEKLEIPTAIFNIIFVDNERIHEINKEYRKVDRVTDVISFAFEDNDKNSYNNIRILGEIYICIPRMKEQAKMYGHNETREIAFLAVHGLLHLLGYDHTISKEEEEKMFRKQELVLNGFNKTQR